MLTKAELSWMLNSIEGLRVGEGEAFLDAAGEYPKVAYWEMMWRDEMASGKEYEQVVAYQISFESNKPRDPALLSLKKALNAHGLHPDIYHERVQSKEAPAVFHSFFTLEVEENILGD